MIKFSKLEKPGLSAAVFSERGDGDCHPAGEGNPRWKFCAECGIPPQDLICLNQAHGHNIAVVSEKDRGRGALSWDTAIPETDAIITATPGLPISIFVADCVPVYLFDPQKKAAGLVHAGREGTRQDILGKAIQLLTARFGVNPSDLHVLIGPSAGPDVYEVSREIANEWRNAGLHLKGRCLNLWKTNHMQAEKSGVPGKNIYETNLCTISDERFFSYRRGDKDARNMALIAI